MSIGENILEMAPEELKAFVARERRAREVTPKRKPQRNTVKSLAKAWNIPEEIVKLAAKEVSDGKK